MLKHDAHHTHGKMPIRGLGRALRRERREELDGSSLGRLQGGQAAQKQKEGREHGSVLSITIDTQCKDTKKVKDKANPRDATPIKQPAETLEVSRRLENQGTYGVYN